MSANRYSMVPLLWAALMVHTPAAQAEWYVEAGPWYRGDMSTRAEGGTHATAAAVRPGSRGSVPAGLPSMLTDDGSTQLLRSFDDGYVGPSGWPLFFNDGLTQYFGYERETQYDAGANTLTFTRQTVREASGRQTITHVSTAAEGWSSRQSMDGAGLQGTFGYVLQRAQRKTWGLQAQLGWLGGIDASFRNQPAYQQTVTRTTREHTVAQRETVRAVYDTLGNPAFPTAPYAMTDPNGIGPLIADTPTSISSTEGAVTAGDRVVARNQITSTSLVDLKSEADLFMVSLGPRLAWEWNDHFSLMLQGGVTLNLFDVQASRSETLRTADGRTLATWTDQRDRQEWLLGAGASVGGQWHFDEPLRLLVSAGYDWVEQTTLGVGPDRIRYDLSGYRLDFAVGWQFR